MDEQLIIFLLSCLDGEEHINQVPSIADDIAAKRRIVDLYENAHNVLAAAPEGYRDGYLRALEEVISVLAVKYDQHPDYRDEWRP
jgi:hypothetical protein